MINQSWTRSMKRLREGYISTVRPSMMPMVPIWAQPAKITFRMRRSTKKNITSPPATRVIQYMKRDMEKSVSEFAGMSGSRR